MRRRLIATIGLLAAGLLAAGTAGTATAQDAPERPLTFENVSRGGGQASVDAVATPGGRLSVDTDATGGGIPGIPPLLPGLPVGPSVGGGDARIIQPATLAPGTYQITVTYSGASAVEAAEGSRASTTTGATTSVSYVCGFDCGTMPPPLIAFEELPSAPGTVTSELTLTVGPDGGSVEVVASVGASSYADGNGSEASATASTGDTDIEITRVG